MFVVLQTLKNYTKTYGKKTGRHGKNNVKLDQNNMAVYKLKFGKFNVNVED